MDKTTKILIILIFACSLGFLIFAAKTVERVEMQKELITSLQNNVLSLKDTVNSLQNIVNTSKTKIESMKTEMSQLKQELASAIEERKKAIEDLAVVQEENKQLSSELSEATEKVSAFFERVTKLEKENTSLDQMITGLENNLKDTRFKLATAEDKLAKLQSVGILVEREAIQPGNGKTPQIEKAIEGKIVDVKPAGVVAINFKGSIKPQKGTTFYVVNSDQVKARLTLEEVYNTIMIAHMDVEQIGHNIKDGDEVRLILWQEERN